MALLARSAISLRHLQVPPVARRFQSDSIDAVRAYVARGDADHSRQALGSGPLGWEHVLLPGRLLQLHWVSQRLGQILRGGYTVDPMVHVPLSDTLRYRFGRRRIGFGVGQAVFIAPGQHYDVHAPPGTTFALGFSPDNLAREIKPYIRIADSVWLPRTCRLTLAGEEGTPLLEQLAELIRALASGEPDNVTPLADPELVNWLHTKKGNNYETRTNTKTDRHRTGLFAGPHVRPCGRRIAASQTG